MLRCVQTENFPTAAAIISSSTEMSVLERQKAMLQRLYLEQQDMHTSQTTMPLFDQYNNFMNSLKMHNHCSLLDDNTTNSHNLGFASSEITTNVSANSSRDQHVGSTSTKKRKAEFEVEMDCQDKRVKGGDAGEAESGITVKSEKENSGRNSKASMAIQKTDYIHVRARRGQATDSHSLAERARREKISKKMKCLQDLVPGCNKVTGKAGMLDEIINYVQSLQKQVEFLSMKLTTLNPRLDFNMDSFFAKEIPSYVASFPANVTPIEMVHSALVQYNQGQQQESTSSGIDLTINPAHQMPPQKTSPSSMLFPELYLDSVSSLSQLQQMSTWDSDWQSLFNVGFH